MASRTRDLDLGSVAVLGLGVTNTASARALVARGHQVVLADDGPPELGESLARELSVDHVHAPSGQKLHDLVARVDAVLPAPGIPDVHPVFASAAAAEVPIISEFDLAARWDDRDVLAVTATNGKTTVVTMVAAMLEASGVTTAAVGNLEVPLVAAIDDPRPSCFVVEASSFRLARSAHFAPRVATWLNFSPDHLDVHRDLAAYRAAKARIWAHLGSGDTAVVSAEDPVVAALAPTAGPARIWRFGLSGEVDGRTVDFFERDGALMGPGDTELARVSALWSGLRHDRSNALAAAATALAGGADVEGIRSALADFGGLPHRVQLVGETDGVRYYDDSKATAPHATLAAASGFDRVILVAGGRNKGLDLSELTTASSVVGVIGIGEAGPEVVDLLADRPGVVASCMEEAVAAAAAMASNGDVVLLSPGCASFDWYTSYAERGDDFATEVRKLIGAHA